MIIIVESGSTKSDWVLLDGAKQSTFKTIGLNPYFHTEMEVESAILENKELAAQKENITQIMFYGAGCSAPHLNDIIRRGIQKVFKKADISIDHDLTACAYATYNGAPSISCILGTGSNSCYYDGVHVYEEVPALGYILGDEGSGSYFGKKLIADFLYKKLPNAIDNKLLEDGWNKDRLIDLIYKKPHANVFLASFMTTIVAFKKEPYIKEMVKNGFIHFIKNHVKCFENHKQSQVHFVGSVAYFFADILSDVCMQENIAIGSIIRRPIDGLIAYHSQKLVNA